MDGLDDPAANNPSAGGSAAERHQASQSNLSDRRQKLDQNEQFEVPVASGSEAAGASAAHPTAPDRRQQPPAPTSTDPKTGSPLNKELSAGQNVSTGAPANREAASLVKPETEAPTGGYGRSQRSWYQMRDSASKQMAADERVHAQAQPWGAKPASTAGAAVTDRPLSDPSADGWLATDRPLPGQAPDWPVDDKSVKLGPAESPVVDGKDARSKPLPWSDNPDPTTRSTEIRPPSGTKVYGGITPDGRAHPFGLGGRLVEGKVGGAKESDLGAGGSVASDKTAGQGQANPSAAGLPVLTGQIIDGHGGVRPPVIWSPFADNGPAKAQEAESGEGQKGGGRQTRPDGKTPAEALIAFIDSIKGGIDGRLGHFGKAGPSDQAVKSDRVGRGDPFIKPIQVGKQDQVGKQQKYVLPGQIGKGDKSDSPNLITLELTLTAVKTKPWPRAKYGSPTNAVAILVPFLSGAKGALPVTRDVTQKTTKHLAIEPRPIAAKPGPTLTGPGTAPYDDKDTGFNTVKMKPLDASGDGEKSDRTVNEGKQKARPSVNLHLPGGTYGGGRHQAETEAEAAPVAEADNAGTKASGGEVPIKPWMSSGTEETLDSSPTVVSLPRVVPLEAMKRSRPARAIDELEATVQMEGTDRSPLKRANAQTVAPAIEPVRGRSETQSSEDSHIASSELSRGPLQKDDQFTYVVQQGDTIESVALAILKDPMLASLLFSINRRYVLPEEQYGVHPLMVGVVIQLPAPSDILKYKKLMQ